MSILKYKYKAHKFINYIFYIIVFLVGFLIGFSTEKINFNKLISQVLMIDNVSAYTSSSLNEEIIYNKFSSSFENFDIEKYSEIICYTNGSSSTDIILCWAFENGTHEDLYFTSTYNTTNTRGSIKGVKGHYTYLIYLNSSFDVTYTYFNNGNDVINLGWGSGYFTWTNIDLNPIIDNSSDLTNSQKNAKKNAISSSTNSYFIPLDFEDYMVKYDAQVNTWNGYGYDYYTNQLGIIDMRKDTYILNSHTCPNDGEFVSGYNGDTNDICYWSYNNDLSDYLVFYFNARNYDSENVEWSNITFLKDHTYTLNFTLYGLVDSETLSSIQFSLEGALTQEIFSTSFTKILRESMDEKTYLTFAITPTEDIEMDHFFLKFNTNDSYAQTIGANRLWTYKDYTNVPIEQIQIEQTDKLLMQNEQLKDLINNPFVNSENVNNFWDKFEHKDYGLTQIITAPINTIKKISNGTCTPYNITILGKTIQLPCGDTIFWNREDVESFKIFWNMFWGGILCYGIGKLIIKDVQKATNPNSDKLEVIDL